MKFCIMFYYIVTYCSASYYVLLHHTIHHSSSIYIYVHSICIYICRQYTYIYIYTYYCHCIQKKREQNYHFTLTSCSSLSLMLTFRHVVRLMLPYLSVTLSSNSLLIKYVPPHFPPHVLFPAQIPFALRQNPPTQVFTVTLYHLKWLIFSI